MGLQTKIISGVLALIILFGVIYKIHDMGSESGYNEAVVEYNQKIDEQNLLVERYKTELQDFKELSAKTLELKIAEVTNKYLDGVEDGKDEVSSIVSDLNADNIRLSVNLKRAETSANKCDIRVNAAASSGDNAPERAELSQQDAQFFISLANEADDTVRQLTACQALVTTYSEQAKYFNEEIKQYRKTAH